MLRISELRERPAIDGVTDGESCQCSTPSESACQSLNLVAYSIPPNGFSGSGGQMDEQGPEHNEWAVKGELLIEESRQIIEQCLTFRSENKLSIWDMHFISEASNNTFRQAGLLGKAGIIDDAISYNVTRQAIHAKRQKLVELHPELEDELNRICPPRQQRKRD